LEIPKVHPPFLPKPLPVPGGKGFSKKSKKAKKSKAPKAFDIGGKGGDMGKGGMRLRRT
jgi:hypothetical protein